MDQKCFLLSLKMQLSVVYRGYGTETERVERTGRCICEGVLFLLG